MGVYIYQHKVHPFIKVGHYIKGNPWSRVAHRGFRCCKHPSVLDGQLMIDNLGLVAWFPDLNTADEKKYHRTHRTVRADGEWYSAETLPNALSYFEKIGRQDMSMCDKDAAMATRRRL
jgi:hypothetical protein